MAVAAKVSSGKAEARHALEDLFPDAFTDDPPGEYIAEVQCVDVLQRIHGFVKRGYPPGTGMRLLERMKHRSEVAMKGGCKVVILCFDRIEKVPDTKGQEQAKRDEGKAKRFHDREVLERPERVGEKGWKELEPPYFGIHRHMPYDLEEGLSDREGFAKELVRWICYQLIACPEVEGRFSIPPECEVIISGHRLTVDDMKTLGMTAEMEHAAQDYNVHVRANSVSLVADDWHRIGEAETQFCYFAAHRPEKLFEFVSTDTDVLYLAALMADKIPTKQFRWTFARAGEKDRRANANLLLKCLKEGRFDARNIPKRVAKPVKPPTRTFLDAQDPLWCMILTSYAAGSDYTDGYHGTTHRTFFEALFGYFDAIGDLLIDGELSGAAYSKLVVVTYILTKFPNLDVTTSILQVRQKSAHFVPRGQLPPDEIVAERCMHLLHHFRLLQQAGARELSIPEPMAYGFHTKNPTEPPSRDNISRQRTA